MKPQTYQLKRYRKCNPRKEYYELRINGITVSSCYVEYMGDYLVAKRDRDTYRLYAVMTKPEYRRRGYAYTLLYHVLHSYRLRGYRLALTATACAIPLYESLGMIRTSIIWPEYEIQL